MTSTLSKPLAALAIVAAAFAAPCAAFAQEGHPPAAGAPAGSASVPGVRVDDAWMRPSLAGSKNTSAYFRLNVTEPMTLVSASSPIAGMVELHEMKLDGDVMRMRAVNALGLSPGKPVEFKPGGHHLMLMDLKGPVVSGSVVPVTLVLRDKAGAERRIELRASVAAQAPGMAGGAKVQMPAAAQAEPRHSGHDHRH